ncbi:hypothetical protein [Acidipropionibacterium timonense]|uniref:hypothetical protein n=1 Tax=Acidipropionibacterium timonense TaxID=2161818 RepID=UPI001031D72F|nr:hypothetical protein [Acidipropionibacterium timonense]
MRIDWYRLAALVAWTLQLVALTIAVIMLAVSTLDNVVTWLIVAGLTGTVAVSIDDRRRPR